MQLAARYYDGRTSQAHDVRLLFSADNAVRLTGEGVSLRFDLASLEFDSRLGNTPRTIRLPNGGKCEVADNDALDTCLGGQAVAHRGHWIHRLESNLVYVLLAVVITAGFSWGMLARGIPWMAEQAAYALPHSVDRQLGQGALKTLDGTLFTASKLDAARQRALRRRFSDIAAKLDDGDSYRVEFRHSERIGANAFALPSGIVVVTDALVNLAANDDQVVAVLAHEVGHLEQRHSLRMVMQDSALALLISTLTGDPFSSSALAVALPTLVVHARYSREFEVEADDYAYEFLRASGIPTQTFADVLERLDADTTGSGSAGFLSSHPGTGERARRFRGL